MNVCMITFQYPPMFHSGVASASYRIGRNLARIGLNVHVITPGPNDIGPAVEPVWEEGVTVHRTFSGLGSYHGNPVQLREIGDYAVKLHREVGFDLVHGMSLMPAGWLGAVVAEEIGRPLVASIPGSDGDLMCYDPMLFESMRWVLDQALFVTTVTDELLEKARRIADISDARVIPNAFDPGVFDPRSLREAAAYQGWQVRLFVERFLRAKKRGGPLIGTTGIIRYVKGFPILLEAFRSVLNVCPMAYLLVVGDFADREEREVWVQRIKAMGLKRRVFITGPVPYPQVLTWVREMDIFAFPSLRYGCPNALLEAMGCGLPVVATDVGRIPDLITEGEDGMLVLPADVDGLARKLIVLAEDEELRRRLGESAKRMVETGVSREQETEAWVEVYRHVTGRDPLTSAGIF